MQAAFAFLPVVAFLALLRALDSFKLVPIRRVLVSLALGSATALLAWALHSAWFPQLDLTRESLIRYVAPASEEFLKLLPLVWLLARHRVGFAVDAAIHGFAVGAGFALLENAHYVMALGDATVWLWIVRGFGTAILHGTATACATVIARELHGRERRLALSLIAGWAFAVLIHSAYNHFLLPPMLGALAVFLAAPLVLVAVFRFSERATRRWLGSGFDTEAQLLEHVMAEDLPETPVGKYLYSLRDVLEGPILGDMLCLLRVQLELSIRAKGLLLAREAGLELEIGDDVRANLAELEYLEDAVGRTGRRALEPVLRPDRRHLWSLQLLAEGNATSPSGTAE